MEVLRALGNRSWYNHDNDKNPTRAQNPQQSSLLLSCNSASQSEKFVWSTFPGNSHVTPEVQRAGHRARASSNSLRKMLVPSEEPTNEALFWGPRGKEKSWLCLCACAILGERGRRGPRKAQYSFLSWLLSLNWLLNLDGTEGGASAGFGNSGDGANSVLSNDSAFLFLNPNLGDRMLGKRRWKELGSSD